MTNEEMETRWPFITPYECDHVHLFNKNECKKIVTEVTQDTIDEIIAYFEAARESMNA